MDSALEMKTVRAQSQEETVPACRAGQNLGLHFVGEVWALPAQDLLGLIVLIEALCRIGVWQRLVLGHISSKRGTERNRQPS